MIGRTRAFLDVIQPLMPWAGFAVFMGIATLGNIGHELREVLLKWGPGLLIVTSVMQYAPMLARAFSRQADAMVDIAKELQELPRRDDMKFQDLSLGQELILKDLGELKRRIAL